MDNEKDGTQALIDASFRNGYWDGVADLADYIKGILVNQDITSIVIAFIRENRKGY